MLGLELVVLGPIKTEKKDKKEVQGKEKKRKRKSANDDKALVDQKPVLQCLQKGSFFSHKSLHQFTGFEHRELLFGFDVFIKNYIKSTCAKRQKKGLSLVFGTLQEMCALTYTKNARLQKSRLVQQRMWVLVFLLPKYLLQTFGKAVCTSDL